MHGAFSVGRGKAGIELGNEYTWNTCSNQMQHQCFPSTSVMQRYKMTHVHFPVQLVRKGKGMTAAPQHFVVCSSEATIYTTRKDSLGATKEQKETASPKSRGTGHFSRCSILTARGGGKRRVRKDSGIVFAWRNTSGDVSLCVLYVPGSHMSGHAERVCRVGKLVTFSAGWAETNGAGEPRKRFDTGACRGLKASGQLYSSLCQNARRWRP